MERSDFITVAPFVCVGALLTTVAWLAAVVYQI